VSRPSGGPPPLLVAVGLLGATVLVLPVVALLVRVPWSDVGTVLASTVAREALVLLASSTGRPAAIGRAVVLLPIVLPPVVGGVALLAAFGRNGPLGVPLDDLGVVLPFSPAGVVLAQVFVAMPFLVVTVEAALRELDRPRRDAAATLGASGWRAFRQVSLPAVAPAVLAGAALAWARALGEFGATITFAGNLPGRTQTLPLAVYLKTQTEPGTALVLSALLVVVSLVVLVVLRGRWLPGLLRR
jgi:molybdate transport system permease protein